MASGVNRGQHNWEIKKTLQLLYNVMCGHVAGLVLSISPRLMRCEAIRQVKVIMSGKIEASSNDFFANRNKKGFIAPNAPCLLTSRNCISR